MTEAMLFLQKTILLSYDPRPFGRGHIGYLSYSGESGVTTGVPSGFKRGVSPPP